MSSEEIEPDAWQRKDDAYYTYPPTWHAAVDTDYDKISRFKPLFSRETIQEVINKQIRHHENIKVDAWNNFEENADAQVRERAEKHAEIVASLKEVKEVFQQQ